MMREQAVVTCCSGQICPRHKGGVQRSLVMTCSPNKLKQIIIVQGNPGLGPGRRLIGGMRSRGGNAGL